MISQQHTADMAEIMRKLNEGQDYQPPEKSEEKRSHPDPDVNAMKNILQKMNDATSATINESKDFKDLKEAYTTEKTDEGCQIGEWKIVVIENENIKTYDVVHSSTNNIIAEKLYLYEAAYGLVKFLNNGVKINEAPIKRILEAEEKYFKYRSDAISMKKRRNRLMKEGKKSSALIAENRFHEAKSQANLQKERLQEMVRL